MTDLQINLQKLEALYEARHETDKLFSEKDVDLTLKIFIVATGIFFWLEAYFHFLRLDFLSLFLLIGIGFYLGLQYGKINYLSYGFARIEKFYRMASIYYQNKITDTSLKQSYAQILVSSNNFLDKMVNKHWINNHICAPFSFVLFVYLGIFFLNVCLVEDYKIVNIYLESEMILMILATYFISSRYSSLDTLELGFSSDLQQALQIDSPPLAISCQPPNLWLHLALTLPTLGLNWIYVDYRLTVEAQNRFAESARVQGAILQALKQLAEESTELTEAIENA